MTKRNGRPPFEPTDEQRQLVEELVSIGVVHDDICRLIINPQTDKPIDANTLAKHFRTEIDTGAVKANLKVGKSLHQKAVSGDVTAGIWWTKCRMGWKDTTVHDHTGTVKFERIERTIVDPKHSDR